MTHPQRAFVPAQDQTTRTKSFGEGYKPTPVDRFGIWLSRRRILRYLPKCSGSRVADFGCGYDAPLVRSLLDRVEHAVVVDVSISPEVRSSAKITAVEGSIPQACATLPSGELDVIFCISVLEHLWRPVEALGEFRRLLAPGGICLINVPSWRGKTFLEYSAFQLRLSPMEEMNDHKCYYDVKDLWPLLVQAGFRPSDIECFSHKFGLNTFAICRVPR